MPDDVMDAGIGHNLGPAFDADQMETFKTRAKEMGKGSIAWGEAGVNSMEDAQRLNDFIQSVSALHKEIDKARVEAKKPFDEQAKAIQSAFKPLLDPLAAMKKKASELLTSYHRRVEAEEAERLRKEGEAAEAERKAAEKAAEIAREQGDEVAAAEMDQKAHDAADAAAKAAKGPDVKIESASGGGKAFARRKEKTVTISNPVLLAGWYAKAGNKTVLDALQKAAEADVRSRSVDHTKIPGIHVEIT